MNNAPILYPGDEIHIVVPDSGDGGAKVHEELTTLYASRGVHVLCTSAVAGLHALSVVAVFRKPSPGPGFRKRPDGLWEEK